MVGFGEGIRSEEDWGLFGGSNECREEDWGVFEENWGV
jgi:hypothetical protein